MTREEAIKLLLESKDNGIQMSLREWKEWDKRYFEAIDMAIEALQEQKVGYWMDKKVFTIEDIGPIEEWQSCCCSECGRYDTSPYSYYFREPNYCSWCGSKMEKRKPEECE